MSMEPRVANLVSFSATRIDLPLVRDNSAMDDIAPMRDSLDGFGFGVCGPGRGPVEKIWVWIVEQQARYVYLEFCHGCFIPVVLV